MTHAGDTYGATAARTTVDLQHAVDAVRATFTAISRTGVSTARITLSPESLGGLKISLSQTPDGLIARVVADHPEAMKTVEQSAGELRRSLEASGVPLLRLDIEGSGAQDTGSSRDSGQNGSSAPGHPSAQSAPTDDETLTTQTIHLSDGSLVNILA